MPGLLTQREVCRFDQGYDATASSQSLRPSQHLPDTILFTVFWSRGLSILWQYQAEVDHKSRG